MEKLLLIDGHAILHRAFHALPPLTNRAGTQTNAVYGFTTMLLRLLETQKPHYLAVAFDLPQPTFRMQIWTQYQEKRPEMQANLAEQIPLVHELLDALGVCYFEVPGYEADDVIGTIAARGEGLGVSIVTGDRDMLQLINDHVNVIVPVRGLGETKLYNEQVVYSEFGVYPRQWVDVKALKGDSSDNYPGVRGIGPKTAQELIAKYNNLENLYKHLGELKPQLQLKLSEGVEMAGLSQKLARIVTDVPIHLDLDSTDISKINWQKGVEYMRSVLGFRSIADKIDRLHRLSTDRTDTDTKPKSEQMELI